MLKEPPPALIEPSDELLGTARCAVALLKAVLVGATLGTLKSEQPGRERTDHCEKEDGMPRVQLWGARRSVPPQGSTSRTVY